MDSILPAASVQGKVAVADKAADLHAAALACFETGDPAAAAGLLRQAIELNPQVAGYHANLAVMLKGIGTPGERIALYRRAIALDPADPATYANLAAVLTDADAAVAAEASARRGLAVFPARVESWINLGGSLAGQKRWADAAAAFDKALQFQPGSLAVLQAAGRAHFAAGQVLAVSQQEERGFHCRSELARDTIYREQARSYIHPNQYDCLLAAAERYRTAQNLLKALPPEQRRPYWAPICKALGEVLAKCFDHVGAAQNFREALAGNPDDPALLTDLGNALKAQGRLDEAVACYRRVATDAPHLPGAHVNLGTVFQTLGRHEEAAVEFRAALALDPNSLPIYSNLGTSLTYSVSHGPADLKLAYEDFDRIVARPLRDPRPYANDRDPDRRLRVGYVSPDFRKHAVAYFALPLLESHRPGQVEVVCYYNHRQDDEWTQRFKAGARQWVDCVGMDHATLAERIRDDRIDILVDLAGHTENNRLLCFARKPAPVQVTWMGYVTTTGLSAMDYRLTHADADPAGVEADYAETLVRLPGTMWCYRPLAGMPEVSPPPFPSKGHITFGAFNRFSKAPHRVLQCWARILAAVPDSRLVLCIPEGAVRQEVVGMFVRHGVKAGRLTLFSKVSHEQFWALHGEVDIALDPFPFNGGTTTCETLWLGVPLVTCTGGPGSFAPRFASRMGRTFLKAIGLPELAAANEAEYVRIAVDLAGDPARLAALRLSLRIRMADSPLTDEQRFAAEVEAAYRVMWRKWCASGAFESVGP